MDEAVSEDSAVDTSRAGESASDAPTATQLSRAYAQLLRQQERALELLQRIATDLGAPVNGPLLETLQSPANEELATQIEQVAARIDDAMKVAEECQSAIHRALVESRGEPPHSGPANLPPPLRRFLAQRKDSPGFTFDVSQDPVRGWIIRWKEYGEGGSVFGGGQFYERPYAWLET